MPAPPAVPQPQTKAGIASAEDGLVVLDGPDGVAVTMTPDAATRTGQNLISAAEIAERQRADKDRSEGQ
ncbi:MULTISPECIES: hypothetical protein [Sphingomonadales]|uniref:Uncharacterized protein n=1 Tax=Edaphosphingomonas haloaromaticamans TaxID=653954 RepID=A0A1S1HBP8_9SPHN|nr:MULTISPECIES: hypothetical protein [Sphingomonas]AGH51104.1 hypothetical protein G432_16930 [Sphingomonas sp. MM-1]OHT19659.1 hypothetical protein BHE75_01647 [Sphingomonas haloaromaticamans]